MLDLGLAPLVEFKLSSGRRIDVMGLDRKGLFTAVEIKSGREDFRADGKWPEYLDFCDAFYFAVAAGLPPRPVARGSGGDHRRSLRGRHRPPGAAAQDERHPAQDADPGFRPDGGVENPILKTSRSA